MFGGLRRSIITLKANDPHLSNLISEEKDKIGSIKATSSANTASTKYFGLWGEQEYQDIKDVSNAYQDLSNEFSLMILEWEYAQNEFRERLKGIRTQSDNIRALKGQVKACADKVEKARKAGKPFEEIMVECRALEMSLKKEIASFEGYKRAALREGMVAQFKGISKFAQKANVYSTFGMHLAEQIPQFDILPGEELPTYKNQSITSQIKTDFQVALHKVRETIPDSSKYRNPIDNTNLKSLATAGNTEWANFIGAPASPTSNSPQHNVLFDIENMLNDQTLEAPMKPTPDSFSQVRSDSTVANLTNDVSSSNLILPAHLSDNPW